MQTFVHATEPVGWFVFKNLTTELEPVLVAPRYRQEGSSAEASPVSGQDLQRLGYEQGSVIRKDNELVYHQKGYGDFSYDVVVKWERQGNTLYGTWSITSSLSGEQAEEETSTAMLRGLAKDYKAHLDYWEHYWAQSSVSLPDSILQNNIIMRCISSVRQLVKILILFLCRLYGLPITVNYHHGRGIIITT